MDFEYNRDTCNIKGCNNKINSHIMCDYHMKKYLTSDELENILTLVNKKHNDPKSLSKKEKKMIFMANFVHYTTSKHVVFVEHFPLESIFLIHKKILFDTYKHFQATNNMELKRELLQQSHELIRDFDFKENIFITDLKQLIFILEDSPESMRLPLLEKISVNNEIEKIILNSTLFKMIVICTIALYSYSKIFNLQLLLILNMDARFSMIIGILSFLWVNYGLKYIYSLDSLSKKALEQNLYNSKSNNNSFINSYLSLKGKIKKDSEFIVCQVGSFCGIALFKVYQYTKLLINSDISTSVLITSVATSILLLLLFYHVYMVFPIMTSFSGFIDDIPVDDIKIDLYIPDKSINISEIKKSTIYNIIFNMIFFIGINHAISYLLFKENNTNRILVYIISLFFFIGGLTRIRNIRYSAMILLNTYKSFRELIATEKQKINNSKSSDNIIKYTFVTSLRFFRFNPLKIFKRNIDIISFILPYIIDRFFDIKLIINKIIIFFTR